jgi:hypothetical protein
MRHCKDPVRYTDASLQRREGRSVTGHVFVSYSRGDGDYVTDLVGRLRARGLTVWTDQGVSVGARWVREIERQIIACAAFVPVMSDGSSDANWVDREIDLAEEQKKPIAPLLLSGRPFFRLRHLQYEDVRARNMPSEEFIAALQAMIEEGRQVPLYRGTARWPPSVEKMPHGVPPGTKNTFREGSSRNGKLPSQSRWMALAWGVAMFLLFFVGTFGIMRAVDAGDNQPDLGVAVGSCVSKGADGTLIAVSCASEGAQVVTQIAEAGRFCDDPQDIQHIFSAADRSSICVSSGK